jgi:hypothetical protein
VAVGSKESVQLRIEKMSDITISATTIIFAASSFPTICGSIFFNSVVCFMRKGRMPEIAMILLIAWSSVSIAIY